MSLMNRKLMLWVCVLALVSGGALDGLAEEAPQKPGPWAKVADAAIIRPLGVVSTLAGGVLYVVSYPVAAAVKGNKTTADLLVVRPANATFKRPLGDLDGMAD